MEPEEAQVHKEKCLNMEDKKEGEERRKLSFICNLM